MYRLVQRRGRDTLHDDRPLEECNVDDATDRVWVDPAIARRHVEESTARACEHCLPEGLPE